MGLGALVLAAHERAADACGACYASLSESTVVNDHKMALAISTQGTILWDQIAYSGNPKEFAYIVPVRPGARVEASRDAWFQALDASTRPIVMAPPWLSSGGSSGPDEGCSPGCGASDSALYASESSAGGGGVQVVSKNVVGPYDTVTLRSEDPQALQTWLTQNGYAIPEASAPVIAEYVAGKFDFIALKLRPGQGVREIQPIRIVSPGGADLSLPLRMMQIGAASQLGITLYVLAEGRYRTKSFPMVEVDFGRLIWDQGQARSNYQELSSAAMKTSEGSGRGFLIEYADKLTSTASRSTGSGMTGSPALDSAYLQACSAAGASEQPANVVDPAAGEDDAGAEDAGPRDAGGLEDSDAGDGDAGSSIADAGAGESLGARPSTTACDDLEVALGGMTRPSDAWVARFRANLPYAALADTLVLEASPTQEPYSNIHTATDVGAISSAHIAPRRSGRVQGGAATIAVTVFAVSRLLRRRKRAGGRADER